MTIPAGTASGALAPDRMVLATDLDLIAELADQVAHFAIADYSVEDWHRSQLKRMLWAAAARMVAAERPVPSAVIEALERFQAAETLTA